MMFFKVSEYANDAPFANNAIGRSLSTSEIDFVITESLINAGKAEWADEKHNGVFVWILSPQQLADDLFKWAQSTGESSPVFTLEEIDVGDETRGQSFHGQGRELLVRLVSQLEGQGKATMIASSNSLEAGVKFVT